MIKRTGIILLAMVDKMTPGGKEILTYPRNEHDFLNLKDFASRKSD